MHFFVTHQGYMKIDFSKIIFGNDEMQKAANVNHTCGFLDEKRILLLKDIFGNYHLLNFGSSFSNGT
jgi:hypothetical protein